MTWIQHNESSQYVKETSKTINPYHHFALPFDLVGRSPLDPTNPRRKPTGNTPDINAGMNSALFSWETLPLATNTFTKTVPVVLHFTGKKVYRDMWWYRNWFYPYQTELLERIRRRGIMSTGDFRESIAGGWTYWEGKRDWINWDDGLCGKYEERLAGPP
jgi:hypothetical protein